MRLRNLLLGWLLLPSLALWGLGFGLSYLHELALSHAAFDRTLLGSAQVIGERLQIEGGHVVVDLPPAALEMLRTDAHDRIYYGVREVDGGGHVSGYAGLPLPQPAAAAVGPTFYNDHYGDQAVRIVAHRFDVIDGERRRPLLVQVAETLEARRQVTQQRVALAAAVQLALLAVAAGLIVLGVRRGLAPLKRLRSEVRARDADDLTPIGTRDVPREVAPLIHAINTHTQRQRQLRELQQRFVADASHQLKTPLTLLRAQVDHALQQSEVPAMREVLRQIRDSSLGTQRLVSQLLSLARSDPGLALAKEPLRLDSLAHDVTFELLALARTRAIDLGFEGDHPVTVVGDRVLLHEAIANLVHNAITYTADGGIVTVRVHTRDGAAALTVCDNGPGIPAEERERVFERFYRRPGSKGSGSGLGLSIVKEIADRHGAQLSLHDAAEGPGLCAEMRWPPPVPPDP